MRALRSCLINSLRQGDNAYVHCVSGLSRAPMAAAVLCAMLMGIRFEEAQDIIDQTRHVSFGEGEERMLGPWIDTVLREDVHKLVVPTGFSCRASLARHEEVVVHATTVVEGGTEPLCRWKKGVTGRQAFKRGNVTVGSVEKAANQFGGRFCSNCESMLKASLQIQVEQFFGF